MAHGGNQTTMKPIQDEASASMRSLFPGTTRRSSFGRWRSGVALWGLLAILPGQAMAGAWVQEAGKTLVIVKASHSDSSVAFDDAHHRTRFPGDGKSRLDQLNLYVEHGITADLSFIGNFYADEARYKNDTGYGRHVTRGLGDQEIGLRYRLDPGGGQGAWVGAAQVLVSIPAYDRHDEPALGLGDYGAELRYSVGRGYRLGQRDGYLDAGLAVRLRGADAADEVRFDVASGMTLAPGWMALAEFNVIQGLGNGRGWNRSNLIESNNYDLTKLQLSALHSLSAGTQLQFGVQRPLAGRNTGGGSAVFVAAWWRF